MDHQFRTDSGSRTQESPEREWLRESGAEETPRTEGSSPRARGESSQPLQSRRRRSARYETAEMEEESLPGRPGSRNSLDSGSRTAREVANRYRQRMEQDQMTRGEGSMPMSGTTRIPSQQAGGRNFPRNPQPGGSPRSGVGYEPGRMGVTPAQRARVSEEGRARLAMESRMPDREEEERGKISAGRERGRTGGRPVITGRPGEQQPRRRRLLIAAVAALLAVGAFLAILMALPEDKIGPLAGLKQSLSGVFGGSVESGNGKAANALRFELTNQDQEAAPATLTFAVRTSRDAVDVRLVSADGRVLPTSCLTSGDTTLDWTLTWKAGEAYEGEVAVEILEAGSWKRAQLTLPVKVLPDPSASPLPAGEDLTGAAGEKETGETAGDDPGAADGAQTETVPERTEGAAGVPETLQGENAGEEEEGQNPEEKELPEAFSEETEDELPEENGEAEAEGFREDSQGVGDPDDPDGGEELNPEEEPEAADGETDKGGEETREDAEPEETGEKSQTDGQTDRESAEQPARRLMTVTAAESADPSLIATTVIYNGTKKVVEYARGDSEKIHMPVVDEYTRQKMGILTFRTDAFRQNAAVGTVKGLNSLELLWTAEASYAKGSGQTYYGIGWSGQPAIVKWSKEVREQSDLYDSKKEKTGLKEVIVAGLDGRIYFLDLSDGSATRNSIKVGFPMRGTPCVHPGGAPYINVGQFARKMASRTGTIGLRQFNLYNMKELSLIDGLDAKNNRPYNKLGSFETSALIDRTREAKVMVTAGTNGMLYLINLNPEFDFGAGVYSQSPTTVVMKTKAKGEKDAQTAVEASVAMYDKYVYYADMGGFLRCVDTDNLKTMWAVALGDSVESTPALDWHGEDGLDLYTATMLSLRKKGSAEVKCFDALSGAERWTAAFPVKKDSKGKTASGFRASPVVGRNDLSEYVYYTVNGLSEEGRAQLGVEGDGAALIALRKADGSVAWAKGLDGVGYSSPVAVYDGEGRGAVIQCCGDGSVWMLDGQTGGQLAFLQIDGAIEASPAVYDDILVVGTTERNKNNIYGIRIQ